jgi:hypothetical protein
VALALDGGHSAPSSTSVSCAPASVDVIVSLKLEPPTFTHAPEVALCTFTVRDTGPSPVTLRGTVTPTANPEEGFFHDVPSCTLVPSAVTGVSSCTDQLFTSSAPEFVPHFDPAATGSTIAGAYSGETLHAAGNGSTAIAVAVVHQCGVREGPEGFGYQDLCDAGGKVVVSASHGGSGGGSHTSSKSLAVAGGRLTLSAPAACARAGAAVTVRLTPAGHLHVRRVSFQLGKGRTVTSTRAPFKAKLRIPSAAKHGAKLALHARVSLAPAHGHRVTKALTLTVRVC